MFYNPNLPLILATNSSPLGLDAILSQVDKEGECPVVFASRKLSQAERNYSQIDKEAASNNAASWAGILSFEQITNL
uniref:Uncharacterized protein K02A2.6like [Amphimedon queenslandica] n=1 Tax=Lepeophtheirus salmonis TaxID=72036 RepID=A0A0K2VD79_LEPSM